MNALSYKYLPEKKVSVSLLRTFFFLKAINDLNVSTKIVLANGDNTKALI